MILVDTSAWFASVVEDDVDHADASAWFSRNKERLFVTDYIVDETLTLLKARGESRKAFEIGDLLLNSPEIQLHFLTEDEIGATWQIFKMYSDKEWSFTDCSSRLICERLLIKHAVSFDKHFRQFGLVTVLP